MRPAQGTAAGRPEPERRARRRPSVPDVDQPTKRGGTFDTLTGNVLQQR